MQQASAMAHINQQLIAEQRANSELKRMLYEKSDDGHHMLEQIEQLKRQLQSKVGGNSIIHTSCLSYVCMPCCVSRAAALQRPSSWPNISRVVWCASRHLLTRNIRRGDGAQEDEVLTVKEAMSAPLNAQLQSIGRREVKLINQMHHAEHKVRQRGRCDRCLRSTPSTLTGSPSSSLSCAFGEAER
jgi:hypothetical protein